ncbi:homocysteine S-methyltransferase [Mycolicibacter sinensis]
MANVRFAVPDDTVIVADGGLATELEARGFDLSGDLSDPLWSARLLLDAPDDIAAVHAAFFAAGAMIATTAGYQASFEGFAARGIDRRAAERLLRRSVDLARLAGGGARGHWVAASVGPYGAARADGSEYVGRYGLSVSELTAWHRPRLEVLADAGADVLALETIPDVDEAEALLRLVSEADVPAWLSYTIEGTSTRAGQPLTDAFAVAAGVPQLVAVGVNCCAPDDVLPAIEIAREITGKPVIVYPNSGESWRSGRWAGPARFSPALVPLWVAAGARIIGGCCRVGPADIAAAAAALRRTCTQRENPAGDSQ